MSAYSIRPVERLDDRLLDLLEAVLEEERGERRLEQRREHVAVARETLELLRRDVGAALEQPLPELELPRDDGAARRETTCERTLASRALREVRVALVERPRDRELEHAVAEELEPLVGRRAVGRPGGVRVDLLAPVPPAAASISVPSAATSPVGALLVRRDVVDGLADGLDLLGVLVGDLDSELVLELHDQLDEVERVGVEILLERGLFA